MAEIIDLDFYRKFRVILPVRSTLEDGKKSSAKTTAKSQTRRHDRRHKRTRPDLHKSTEN